MLRKAVTQLSHRLASAQPQQNVQSMVKKALGAQNAALCTEASSAARGFTSCTQWPSFSKMFSTSTASSAPPHAQTSEEAREEVDDAKEVDMAGEQIEKAAEAERRHEPLEPEHAPNVDYLRQKDYLMMYPRYEKTYMESIAPKHQPPEKLYEKTGLWAVTAMRWSFDMLTGYPHKMNEKKWLQRIVFLETVAGMSGAMLRHMKSLRNMKRDNGWIHTLLEEAENERMHLLTFMQMKKPGPFFRGFVLLTQGIFFNLYTMFYLMSPKHCHAFVGYLEEEAVKTYTHCLKDIDEGRLDKWQTLQPPEFSRYYWGLPEHATMRDLIMAVRADEYSHSHVNHTFSKLKHEDQNPFDKGAHVVP